MPSTCALSEGRSIQRRPVSPCIGEFLEWNLGWTAGEHIRSPTGNSCCGLPNGKTATAPEAVFGRILLLLAIVVGALIVLGTLLVLLA